MCNSTALSLLLLALLWASSSSFSIPDRFLLPTLTPSTEPQEYFDPTLPPFLPPTEVPACSIPVLQHDFANTYGLPPATGVFSPPAACPPPWSRIVLDLSVSSVGDQYDRIAAVWIEGVEILRTSTAEPTESGVFWRVRKDITRYAPLLRGSGGVNVSMMLENIVNDVYTGIYKVNVSVELYPDSDDTNSKKMKKRGAFDLGLPSDLDEEEVKLIPLFDDPADVVIPVSRKNSSTGFWFRIQNQSEAHYSRIIIPRNTFKAVLEVYVSSHSNDEFWYWNPPDVYIKENNLTTERGNGAFREVYATIDGRFVGTVLPFPVIFTGGINPLFWSPVVAIGAFDLPSYNLDLTPFLELLLDGKEHSIGLRVTDGISLWLIDANLHLWLDTDSETVSAKLIRYEAPPLSIVRTNKFLHLNGTFKIDAERKVHFSGWVNSSVGNLTSDVNQKLKFKSSVDYQNDGNYKAVHLKTKVKTEVKIKNNQEVILQRFSQKFKNPLSILTETLPGTNNTYTMTTNLSHTLHEEAAIFMLEKMIASRILEDKQDASGWMKVQDHSVLSGSAGTKQLYNYRDNEKCYNRILKTDDGVLTDDTNNNVCAHSF
ncbi:peptide-N4-(N-acetyl-beta-glucosaminyl)asparagine amidase A [Dendrobium catenatum]|uniref:Peptide-N4-(N-acetyl-beta-glucosaminyl)asparagine amidase A n=1 Tax=Dendrobium catenatum TaxID=906689 RepID=A0A2I0WBI2_9ASPA|nr:peptide-N4-(N-acetyl-beta-glucosaminyl)asparagine amidase A [Dendrobium catenatum]PKU73016.1 Peptide-N4-(N-acetyl-beta-glucosaminyl)asparagine amidase A [Dendrobium catenatum]